MRTSRRIWTLSLVLGLAGLPACGDDDGVDPPVDSGTPADGGGVDSGDPADGGDTDSGGDAADIALTDSEELGAYLVDEAGLPLYFFVNDTVNAEASACVEGCLDTWPVFYVEDPTLGEGLEAAGFGSFERGDGAMQTTWRGRPLYLHNGDSPNDATGEAAGGRWFVARAYNVFMAASEGLTPEGGDESSPYLTNGAGRTLYIFENDTAGEEPESACMGGCVDAWPAWAAPSPWVIPSTLDVETFGAFSNENPDPAVNQATFQGWPLYFFATDDEPGEVAGAEVANWAAVSPALE